MNRLSGSSSGEKPEKFSSNSTFHEFMFLTISLSKSPDRKNGVFKIVKIDNSNILTFIMYFEFELTHHANASSGFFSKPS